MAADNILKEWGDLSTFSYQTETRKYWDRTYVYGIKTNGTIGGMSTAADDLYTYCYELTLGGVPKGTWYVPTQAQMHTIHVVKKGMQDGTFGEYSAFHEIFYWCSNEFRKDSAWYAIGDGSTWGGSQECQTPSTLRQGCCRN